MVDSAWLAFTLACAAVFLRNLDRNKPYNR
jgi:hypothetical protein